MLTFRKGMRQGPAAARRMADHLAQRTLPVDVARRQVALAGSPFAAPDGSTLAVPRADLDPVIARRLGIAPRAALGVEAMTRILTGRRADGLPFESVNGDREVAYIDLCLSAEKGVSLLWAAGGDAAKAVIAACQRDAVARTMTAVEAVIGRSRRGQGGRNGSEPGTMSWFTYEQYTARNVTRPSGEGSAEPASDPQCHTHVIVPNVVWALSGRVTALDLQHMGGRVHEFGALFAAFLAEGLRDWGIETVLDRATGMPRLCSVPDAVRRAFSGRSSEGERRARDFVEQAGERFEDLPPTRRVGLVKSGVQKHYRGDRLDGLADGKAWLARAAKHGWAPGPVVGLTRGPPRRDEGERLEAAADLAILLVEPDLQERTVIDGGKVRTAAARALIEAGIEDVADVEAVISRLSTRVIRQDGSNRTLRAVDGVNARGFAVRRYTAALSAEESAELEERLRPIGPPPGAEPAPAAPRPDPSKAGWQADEALALLRDPAHRQDLLWEAARRVPGSEPVHVAIGSASLEAELREASIRVRHFTRAEACLNDAGTIDALSDGSVLLIENIGDVSPRAMLRLLRAQSRQGFKVIAGGRRDDGRVAHRPRGGHPGEVGRAGRIGGLAKMRSQNRAHLLEGEGTALIDAVARLWSLEEGRTGQAPRVTAPSAAFARQLAAALQTGRRRASPGTAFYALDTVDLDGTPCEIHCAVGDLLRLQSRVNARRDDGRRGLFGVAGSGVTVRAIDAEGLHASNGKGDHGILAWDTLRDPASSRLRVSQGLVDVAGRQGRLEPGPRIVIATDAAEAMDLTTPSGVSEPPSAGTLLVVPAQPIRHRLARRHARPAATFTVEDIWEQFASDMGTIQRTPGQRTFEAALAAQRSAAHVLRSASLGIASRASARLPRTTLGLRFALNRAAASRVRGEMEIDGDAPIAAVSP